MGLRESPKTSVSLQPDRQELKFEMLDQFIGLLVSGA